MVKKDYFDLLSDLETAKVNLDDDIKALGIFQDEFLIYSKPKENLNNRYFEMQIFIMTLYKSMVYNKNLIDGCIKEYYK